MKRCRLIIAFAILVGISHNSWLFVPSLASLIPIRSLTRSGGTRETCALHSPDSCRDAAGTSRLSCTRAFAPSVARPGHWCWHRRPFPSTGNFWRITMLMLMLVGVSQRARKFKAAF